MTTYSIWDDIYDTVTTSGITDKHDLAAKIAENIPSRHLRTATQELLPQAVLMAQNTSRRTVMSTGDKQRRLSTTGRTAQMRSMPHKELVVHVPVGATEHVAKRLGDCTVDDLEAIACGYDLRAEQNRTWAAKYRTLTTAMATAKAVLVDDLDNDILKKALA